MSKLKEVQQAYAEGMDIIGYHLIDGVDKTMNIIDDGAINWSLFENLRLRIEEEANHLYVYTDNEGYYDVIKSHRFCSKLEANRWVSLNYMQGSIECYIPASAEGGS